MSLVTYTYIWNCIYLLKIQAYVYLFKFKILDIILDITRNFVYFYARQVYIYIYKTYAVLPLYTNTSTINMHVKWLKHIQTHLRVCA